MAVKLLSFVDGHIKDEDYYLLLADVNERKEDDVTKTAVVIDYLKLFFYTASQYFYHDHPPQLPNRNYSAF